MEKEMLRKRNNLISTTISPHLSGKASVEISFITEAAIDSGFLSRSDHPYVWLCLDGSFTMYADGKNFVCKPGTAVIIPAGSTYCIQKGDIPLCAARIFMIYNAYSRVDIAEHIASVTHLLLPAFSKELGFYPPRIVSLSDASLEEARKIISVPSLSSLEKFFSLPEFSLTEAQKKKAHTVATKRLLPVLNAMTYIQKNYSQKITGEELAKETGLCRTNLFTFFKKYLGVSPLTYLVMIRVIRAQFALTHTQYSLQYISDMCGFANCSHMSKCYRQYKGFLPREDRAKMRAYRKKYPDIHVSHDYFFDE